MNDDEKRPRTVRMTDELWMACQHVASASGFNGPGAWIRHLIEREIAGVGEVEKTLDNRIAFLTLRAILQVWEVSKIGLSDAEIGRIRIAVQATLEERKLVPSSRGA